MYTTFGSHVFNDAVMHERLPKETYQALKRTIQLGESLDKNVASVVANAMKDWAIEQGATHYTHWFQPMTGKTAEKHDSFLSLTDDGRAIMEFSGKELSKGESDASSLPSGGLRATFEARGYTAWDCTSPAFLKEDKVGVTLYIPTAFCSYTAEALDKKTPLLRSMQAISKQALRILRLFGNNTSNQVISMSGPEQEYFLVEKKFYQSRKDLMFTGRTLFGAPAPKGQEMEDHYYGSIKERIAAFMKELDVELWKLGVAAKTKHNEVAPGQHEIAPIFSNSNIATDHNQLIMEMCQKIALRHDLVCLLHEKPFAGVNGSGKHNNWSLATNDGINLLYPGKTPYDNWQFLVFLMAVVAAVDEYAPLLRLSAASPGNDYRLGSSEAPPAIISIFLGDELTSILEQIETGHFIDRKQKVKLEVGVTTLPRFSIDTTDRNRTSPMAFTGNKFEFRMVPSSISTAKSNIMLNTMVAEKLAMYADLLEGAEDFQDAVVKLLQKEITEHKRVIFNGDGYSEEWVKEAKRRDLPNIKTSVEAISYYNKPEYIKMFEKHKVFDQAEVISRQEILFEEYEKTVNIEALTMIQMVKREIIPAVTEFEGTIANSIINIKTALKTANTSAQDKLLGRISDLLATVQEKLEKLEEVQKQAKAIRDMEECAVTFKDKVTVAMEELRKPCDELETLVGEKYWPMPTYVDLLYRV